MADDFDRAVSGPRDWSQALSALPAETAPTDAWSRLSGTLDAPSVTTRSHARRPLRVAWYAVAAAVAAMAAAPLINRSGDSASPSPSTVPIAETAAPSAVPPHAHERPGASDATAAAVRRNEVTSAPQTAAVPAAVDTPRRRSAVRHGTAPAASASQDAREIAAASPDETRAADGPSQPLTGASTGTGHVPVAARAGTASDPLLPLYTEAAQLEALVALARDDRVASASGAVLTGELGARIGVIDALLAQPGLSSDERASLWRQRVATLRQLAGVESTERWLAAQGETYGDALVRVD